MLQLLLQLQIREGALVFSRLQSPVAKPREEGARMTFDVPPPLPMHKMGNTKDVNMEQARSPRFVPIYAH